MANKVSLGALVGLYGRPLAVGVGGGGQGKAAGMERMDGPMSVAVDAQYGGGGAGKVRR